MQRQLGVCWGALCRVGEADLPCPELWREAELALPRAQWPIPRTGFLGSASQPAKLCAWSTRGRVRDLQCPGPRQALHNLVLVLHSQLHPGTHPKQFPDVYELCKQGTVARQAKTP